MKKVIMAALAATAMFASAPAFAQASDFSGIRVGVTAGVDDVTSNPDTTDITYGAVVGLDIPVGEKVLVGVEANVDNVFDRRDIGASARLGFTPAKNVLLFGKAGYANYNDAFSRKLDGLRVGGGVEFKVGSNSFVGAEYRYTDFEAGVGKHGVLGTIGIRF